MREVMSHAQLYRPGRTGELVLTACMDGTDAYGERRGSPVGKQETADELGVSKRTVQREFEYLELCIRQYDLKLENLKRLRTGILFPKCGSLIFVFKLLRQTFQYP